MPKYYVQSGKIRHTIDRDNQESAIIDTLKYYSSSKLKIAYKKICVSETGWKKNLKCYDLAEFIK
mgnify:CR=1 FL=1